jgi:hypothetical protein
MIDDMALLKQVMGQMDAEDPVVADAAKDRAAQALSDARLSFSKIADLIEQRGLLLQPRIVANIKRMDQPGMLGDIAFRNTGNALRREGQSFRQIAEAIERFGGPAPVYEDPAALTEPMYQMPTAPAGLVRRGALGLVARLILLPLRRPISFLAIALFAILLIYISHGLAVFGRQVSGYFESVAAVSNSVKKSVLLAIGDKIALRPSSEATPTPPAPIPPPAAASPSATPSAAPPAASAPPVTAPAPAASASAPPAPPVATPRPPSVARAGPPVSTSRREGITRNSRLAGPCLGGVGGCYWGGGRY